VTGTGAGSYDVLFEKYRPEGFRDRTLYAHNDYLNTLSDYGLAGFLLFFGAAAIVAARCASAPREERVRRTDWLNSPTVVAGLAVGLLAFALQLVVEFHLRIPALALAFAIVAAFVVSRRWPAGEASSPPRFARLAAGLAAAGCAAAFLFFFQPKLRAESLRQHARDAIDTLALGPPDAAHYRGPLEFARTALGRATALDPANGQAWADLAYATALWSRVETGRDSHLGKTAQAAAERALGCSRMCAEFWIRRGVARDLQSQWSEAGEDFTAAVMLAPNTGWVWYYYAEHLSAFPSVRETAQAAVALCLRLDPGNLPGQALRERLAVKPKSP
jgi:tetratricopeptide (TPR) repeat protein